MDIMQLKQKMPKIFEKVRKDVKEILGKRRAGLSLGLVDMGMDRRGFIGGMHFHPGTDIVMNKSPLKIILEEQSEEIVWAYTYHILLHEYIHSLGIIDEHMCRALTLRITEKKFSARTHPARILAEKGIGVFFPNMHLIYRPPELKPEGIHVEYIRGFDKDSYSYYS